MRKLGATLHLLFWLACVAPAFAENTVGPGQQVLCNQVAFVTVSSATITSLVAGVAGKAIFSCGWHVTSNQATSTTFQFEYGTQGGPCTSPTAVTPAFSITSTAPSADHISLATYQIPIGAQLCVVTTGAAVGQAIAVYYSQF
jgi:hypothetical protein